MLTACIPIFREVRPPQNPIDCLLDRSSGRNLSCSATILIYEWSEKASQPFEARVSYLISHRFSVKHCVILLARSPLGRISKTDICRGDVSSH
jgi:hypothetical protein